MEDQAQAAGAKWSGKNALKDEPSSNNLTNPSRSPSTANSSPSPPPTSTPSSSTTTPAERAEIIAKHIKMADQDGLRTLIIVLFTILAMPLFILAALINMSVSWKYYMATFMTIGAGVLALIWRNVFPETVHVNGYLGPGAMPNAPGHLLDGLPAVYFLYVLGSGGHTTEMFELIRQTSRPASNVHRRYVYTSGDVNSLSAVLDFEKRVKEHFGANGGGTWDAYQVKRARNVHQPFYTAWATALLSLTSIYTALVTIPDWRQDTPEQRKAFQFPHVITTNGPGNGVMVAIIARLLKLLRLAPNNCMKVIFIETWAHISSLSLTGKIFHRLKFAGVVQIFLVQHKPLAERYGYHLYDFITPNPVQQQSHSDAATSHHQAGQGQDAGN